MIKKTSKLLIFHRVCVMINRLYNLYYIKQAMRLSKRLDGIILRCKIKIGGGENEKFLK